MVFCGRVSVTFRKIWWLPLCTPPLYPLSLWEGLPLSTPQRASPLPSPIPSPSPLLPPSPSPSPPSACLTLQVTDAVRGADVVFHIASYGMSGAESLRADLIYRVNVSVGGVGGVDTWGCGCASQRYVCRRGRCNIQCRGVFRKARPKVKGRSLDNQYFKYNTCNPAASLCPAPSFICVPLYTPHPTPPHPTSLCERRWPDAPPPPLSLSLPASAQLEETIT